MDMNLNQLLDFLWKDYTKLNKNAEQIQALFREKNEQPTNDHIALRTFNLPNVGIKAMEKFFKNYGYSKQGEYHFDVKKLDAVHLENDDPSLPKIFISEILLDQFSGELNLLLKETLQQISTSSLSELFQERRNWTISHSVYETLYTESEYAAWLYAYGFCANHFTVLVNSLSSFKELEDLNIWLKEHSFALNQSGGEIKGSEAVGLRQSSTMAPEISIEFTEGQFNIPGCYYEFAKRYKKENSNHLYQGFVTASADKIFESTNKQS